MKQVDQYVFSRTSSHPQERRPIMTKSNVIGTFTQQVYPDFRNPTIDTLIWGSKRHHVPLLLEVDVTDARALIREEKTKTGQGISFTGWIVKCLAQAISEHKYMQAIRQGDRLILFDDVDVAIVIERSAGQTGETLPMPYIIRKANENLKRVSIFPYNFLQ